MKTAKTIFRFAELRISENKQFGKLSGPRMGVLFILHEAGSIRMGDLASKLHVAPRTVTDLVDGLERDGFIHRIPDPNDRRASLIEMSEGTRNHFEKIASMRTKFVEEIFSILSDEEKALLTKLLIKLQDGPLAQLISGSK